MRNIIAHEYLGIDLALVWETITNHFAPLKIVLKQIVAGSGDYTKGRESLLGNPSPDELFNKIKDIKK